MFILLSKLVVQLKLMCYTGHVERLKQRWNEHDR